MRILVLFLIFLMAAPAFAQEARLTQLTGLPVMDGLEENVDARLVFDKPEGRIVFAQFGGKKTPDEVMAFYRETLFQLGWELDSPKSQALHSEFLREGERLTVAITRVSPLEVTLDLGPEGASQT